ncbi:hypothetical protein [Jannaschia sp. 2305UL9-9]|uniref:hypothetical protein n=1 Tax=Jannaschia sp. 2305UL9-9 TaxID=3121638 RepID=UPI003528CBAE
MAHLLVLSVALATLLSVIAVVLLLIPDRPDLRRRGLLLLSIVAAGVLGVVLWP